MANIPGTAEGDTLNGTDASDTLQGFAGVDFIAGGPGDDIIVGGANSDRLDGGDGNDAIDLSDRSPGSDTITAGGGNDRIGAFGADRVSAGTGDDEVTAGNGAVIALGAGADTVTIPTAQGDADFVGRVTISDLSNQDRLLFPDTPILDGLVQTVSDGINTVIRLDLNRDGIFAGDETEIRLSGRSPIDVAAANLSAEGPAAITIAGADSAPGQGNGFLDLSLAQQVSAIYVGYFGRAADPGGLDFWVGQYRIGLDTGRAPANIVDDIAESFRVGDEATELFPFIEPGAAANAARADIESFVVDVFGNLFDRGPSAAGLDFWSGQIQARLDNGINIGDIIVDIISGAQDGVAVDVSGDGQSELIFDATTVRNKIELGNAYADAFANAGVVWNQDTDTATARATVDSTSGSGEPVADSRIDAVLADEIPGIVGASQTATTLATEAL